MVNVIGLGYIGLPTALMLASKGIPVVGTDCDAGLVERLKEGEITFEERGLPKLFEAALQNAIEFSTAYQPAEIYIVAVPTPYIEQTKSINPGYVAQAVKSILKVAPQGAVIAIESTISPGTVDRVIRPLMRSCDKAVHLVHAPERILPGNMIYELEHNSRTIGCDNRAVGELIKLLYSNFCKGEIILTNIKTAELTKVVENTYRDINIAFANELAKICRREKLDVYEVISVANRHPRVNILSPGPGVGGHCISVDPWFLVGDYPDIVNIILAARKVNDEMPEYVIRRIGYVMKANSIAGLSRVGLYGISYKENVDDVRESPTLQMIKRLEEHLAFGIKCYDPLIRQNVLPGQYQDFEAFLGDIDMVVVMVGHDHLKQNADRLLNKIVLDTRNVISTETAYKL